MSASPPSGKSGQSPRSLARVLAVEDDADVGELVRAALVRSLIDTTLVSSGEVALECLAEDDFDLVLLDIVLPGMTGMEVCRRMKASPDWRDIPVIFISGRATPEDKEEARRLGAAAFIEKPFNLLPFLACVMGHLRLQTNAAQAAPPVLRTDPR